VSSGHTATALALTDYHDMISRMLRRCSTLNVRGHPANNPSRRARIMRRLKEPTQTYRGDSAGAASHRHTRVSGGAR
jgi:hypothetical protein